VFHIEIWKVELTNAHRDDWVGSNFAYAVIIEI